MEYTENICVVCAQSWTMIRTRRCAKIVAFLIENYRPKNMGEQIAAAIALAEATDIYMGVLLKVLEAAEEKMS